MFVCMNACVRVYMCTDICIYREKDSYLHISRKAFQDMHYENLYILSLTLYLYCKSASKNLENLI